MSMRSHTPSQGVGSFAAIRPPCVPANAPNTRSDNTVATE